MAETFSGYRYEHCCRPKTTAGLIEKETYEFIAELAEKEILNSLPPGHRPYGFRLVEPTA
jgi:hypothetical protein